MAGITVTREDLEALLGEPLPRVKFEVVERAALSLIKAHYRRDVDTATGRHAEVLNSVFTSVALRLVTNPTGARTLGMGSANVTFGGSDEDVSNSATLSEPERRMLQSLRAPRPSNVVLSPFYGSPLFNPPATVVVEGEVL